jgi:hypothetical protein
MTDEPEPTDSETVEKVSKPWQFKKGYDPRRNLRGVPKETIKGRALVRKIGAELIHIREKQENGEVVEYDITRAEAMIRLMYSSKQPADKQTLLKALWPGLVKDAVDITSEDKAITFIVKREDDKADNATPEAA